MAQDETTKELLQEVMDKWWIILLRGVVTISIGVLFIFNTQATLTAVILILGIYWFSNGLLDFFYAIM